MRTVNGKLINQEINQFDEITKNTEKINQRCQHLESQVTAISRQDYTQDLQTINQEVNSSKSYLHKLEQKIGFLEEVTSRQAQQLLFLKIITVMGLIGLWFIFGMNNKPDYHKNKPQKKSESMEILQGLR
ncbi:MAG: hypothetical protein DSM106950_37965 [Stigonema ocellatum SAG 48.90 = DSM 106950]|nr:hypothetical protein [Stigonema ocellatum SAG 48.90 = DSM 106950]